MNATEQWTLEDGALKLTLQKEPNHLTAVVTDKANGITWGPAPLLALEVHDKTLRRETRLEKYRVDVVEPQFDGLHVILGDAAHCVLVGLWFRLVNGELSVTLSLPEVYERRAAHFRLFAIDLLPGLLTVNAAGRLLMPIGGGAFCSPADKPKIQDRFLIYLEQDRWELGTTLPYGAVETPKGGMMMLARQGAADAQCRVATDGKGAGQLNFAFSLRRFWPDPVDFDTREFRFIPVPKGADLPMFCATRLRRHALEDLGKKTIKERAAESPEVAYVLKAYTIKPFYARENEGMEGQGLNVGSPISFILGMTFDECRDNLTRLRKAGIEQAYCQNVAWNARGHDGLYPARFPIDERLGGEARFRELIRYGNEELGYHMCVHDNFSMNIPHAPNYDPDVLIHDMFGEPLLSGWWGGGLEYQTWGLALPHDRLEGHLERMQGLGLKGMYYCDYMMRPLEVNYHPRWKGPRSHSARGQVRVLKAAQKLFGASATEYGSLPVIVAADYVCGSGGRYVDASWPIKQLIDQFVPVWDLTVQGLIFSEQTGLSWESAMRAVLFGKHIRDEWTVRSAVRHAPLDDARIAKEVAMYDLCLKRFGGLQTEFITAFSEPAPKVQCTTFSDGTQVSADFGKGELLVNGKRIDRPAALAG